MCAVAFAEKACYQGAVQELTLAKVVTAKKESTPEAVGGLKGLFQQAMESFETALRAG